MDEVARTGRPTVITKHGKPVAQLGPVPPETESLFGYMRNTVRIRGDIVAATAETWSALEGDEDRLMPVPPRKPRSNRGSEKKLTAMLLHTHIWLWYAQGVRESAFEPRASRSWKTLEEAMDW
jgi:antitoxin (DNA-binding transcriptional repressor) of toxin-antitoxin stability system